MQLCLSLYFFLCFIENKEVDKSALRVRQLAAALIARNWLRAGRRKQACTLQGLRPHHAGIELVEEIPMHYP